MIGFNDTTETNLVALCADLAATRLPLDTFWLDAGWNQGGFAGGQGNPDPDPARFPRGLGPVGEAARRHGQRFLAWFEPERVMRGTRLDREHPEWLRLPTGTPPELRYQETDGFRLLDLGFPAARAWTLDYLSGCVTSAGIGVYRQDFNLYPAFFWHTGEPPERRGIAEVGHIAGLYDLLDGLAARHPGLVIDNCASGGRRLDFEMMRRSVALWRSDSCWDDKLYPRNAQAMTHGLSLWLPLHGLGAAAADPVALRSGMGACSAFAIDFRAPAAVQALRTHLDRFLRTRRLYAADFHPLTPWSIDPRQWLAFQFHDPIRGEGIVQAFCGDTAARLELRVRLRGLVPGRRYALSNWDAPESRPVLKGAALAEPGLLLRATRTNDAIVVEYQPAK
jgi:alpha-galactosidase